MTETEVIKGGGIVAQVSGHRVTVGNVTLMHKEGVKLSKRAQKDIKQAEEKGHSLILTAVDGEIA